MITVCTTCQENFDPSGVVLQERPLGNLVKVYFECPYCGTEFHVMYHNAETKKLQKRMNAARENGDMKTFNKLRPIFKRKLDELNNR